MSNFQFKDSRYDFDSILEKRGYTISHDHEDKIVFSKKVEIKNDHVSRFREKELDEMCVIVTRPKILDSSNKYELCSPYVISFKYFVVPHHAIRRMMWDTFPGHVADVFEVMLKLAEDEAKVCVDTFMETDSIVLQIYQKPLKNQEIKDAD